MVLLRQGLKVYQQFVQEGIVATAMYDFQASGDDEISFDPGDTIFNIDKVRNKMHFYNISMHAHLS